MTQRRYGWTRPVCPGSDTIPHASEIIRPQMVIITASRYRSASGGRATCPVCKREVGMNNHGAFAQHMQPKGKQRKLKFWER